MIKAIERPTDLETAQHYLEKVSEHGSATALGKKFKIPTRTARHWALDARKILENKGYQVPPTHGVKGYSTLYKVQEDGTRTVAMEWVKTDKEKETQLEAFRLAVEDLMVDVPREPKTKTPKLVEEDLCTAYILTDYHIGQLSWGEETGEDWDSEKAFELIQRWIKSAVAQAPKAETGILAQLGDFLHWDGMDAVTPTSGHLLDADSRYGKLVSLAIKSVRCVVNEMLKKHKKVHVIMAEGNHDMASSVWLRQLFSTLYENEPRVEVDATHTPYYCYEHGQTSLFFHHGHKKKLSGLTEVFAAQFREIYGRTKYSYAHTGHLHHVEVKENGMMILEQHPTLGAKDAYSARGGYHSKRAANVITYSKRFGEVSRLTIRPEMVM